MNWDKFQVELARLLRKKMSESVDVSFDRNVEELDSLAIVELISFVEEESGVTVKFEALRKCTTVGELRAAVLDAIEREAQTKP